MKSLTERWPYWSLQSLACLVMAAVYGLFLVAMYYSLSSREQRHTRMEWQRVQDSIAELRAKLVVPPGFEYTAEWLAGLEELSWPYVIRITNQLRTQNSKDGFSEYEVSFDKASTVIVARRSRILWQQGSDLEDLMGSGWARNYLLGLDAGAAAFEQKSQYLYPYPVTKEQHSSYQGRFIVLSLRGHRFLTYQARIDGMYLIMLWNLTKVASMDIASEIEALYRLEYPHLVWEGGKIVSAQSRFHPMEFIASLWSLHLMFLLSMALFLSRGGYQLLVFRFEARLALTMLIFFTATYILSGVFVEQIHSALRQRNLKAFILENNRTLTQLDQELVKSGDEYETILNQAIEQGEDLATLLPSECYAVRVRTWDKSMQVLAGKGDPVLLPIAAEGAGLLLNALGHEPVAHNMELPLLRVSPQMISEWNVYVVRRLNKLVPHKFLKQNVYFYNARRESEKGLELYCLILTQNALSKWWLQRRKQNISSGFPVAMLASFADPDLWISFGHQGLTREQVSMVYSRMRGVTDLAVPMRLSGKDGYSVLQQPESIQGTVFLGWQSEDEIFSRALQFMDYWNILSLFYVLLAAGLFVWLTRQFLLPVQQIFQGLTLLKDGQIPKPAARRLRNELGQTLQELDGFAAELLRGRQILPFIGAGMLKILTMAQERQGEPLVTRGVVIFADIRGFTTLSESLSAAEVVDMLNEYFSLWYEVVERYGAIVERFFGDAIRVLVLDDAVAQPDEQALAIASDMMKKMRDWNSLRLAMGLPVINIGIGMSRGEIYVHVLRSRNRLEFFLAGPGPVEAESLEAMSKEGKYTKILVNQALYQSLLQLADFASCQSAFELKSL